MRVRRAVRNVVLGFLAIVLAVFVLAIVGLYTGAFNGMVRAELTRRAQTYGAHMQLGNVRLSPVPLRLDLNDVVVRSAHASAGAPPLFAAKRVVIGVKLLPLLRRRLELERLDADEPVAHLRIDAQGRNNFTFASTRRTASSSGPSQIFDLKIRNIAIHSGEIYYNDAQIPLDADLHDLKLAVDYSPLNGEYKGSLSYDRGHFSEAAWGPVEHDLKMDFTATRSMFSIPSLTLRSGSSEIHLNARMDGYVAPVIEASYQANLTTKEVAAILKQHGLPTGTVTLDGTLNYNSVRQPGTGPQSFLTAINVEGRVRSDRLALSRTASEAAHSFSLDGIMGSYELKNGNFRLQDLGAKFLGGNFRGDANIERIDAPSPIVRMNASLRGLSLGTVSNTFAPSDLQRIPFRGVADLQAQAGWTGPFSSWRKNLVAGARLSLSRLPPSSRKTIPVSGLVQVTYNGRDNLISFGQSSLQTRATRVSIAGALDARSGGKSSVMLNATTDDLGEIASLVAIVQGALQTGATATTMPVLGGSATLLANATGTAAAPHIQGELTAQNLSIGPSHWRMLRAALAASPSSVSIRNASLTGDARQQITIGGDVTLHNWSFDPDSAISVRGAATGLTVGEISQIAHFNYPVSGNVSANVSLSGTKADPEGTANITVVSGSAWSQPFSRLAMNSDFHQGSVHSTANLQTTAGAIATDATYTLATRTYSAQLHANGLELAKIAALAGRNIQGALNVSASGSGTLENPTLKANLTIPQLSIANQAISKIAGQVDIAQRHAKLMLTSSVDQGSVEAMADIDITGSRNTTASLDVRALPVAAIVANFLPAQSSKVGGETEMHVTLNGPLSSPKQMQAHLQIPTLNVTYGVAKLGLTRPLEADYKAGVLTVMNSQIQGTGTNLTFGGSIPLNNTGGYSIAANGTVNLDVVHEFVSKIQSKGELDIHLTGQGGVNRPSMRGQIDLKNAEFASDTLPVSIEDLNGQIAVTGTRAVITRLSGTAGGGTISATGAVDLGADTRFNFGMNAQSVRLRYPQGLRSVLTAQINASGDSNGSTLAGRVSVDSLSFTQQFDLANFTGSLSEDSSGTPPSAFAQKTKLNLTLVSAQDLNLASSRLSVGGSANLRVIGTLADPVIVGRLALTSGEVFFLGKRFEVQSGTIEFPNPTRTDPVLNLYIGTTIEHYAVTLKLSGPVDRLRTSYTSEPTLSQADIIHLLAFGNTNAEAASAAPITAAQSAESVVASGVTSQLTGKLQSLTGISQLTIDPLSENTQGDPGAVIGIQQRVTGSLLFTYSTNVTDTQSQTASLQYDLSKQVSVTVLRDQNGGYGIDIRIHKSF